MAKIVITGKPKKKEAQAPKAPPRKPPQMSEVVGRVERPVEKPKSQYRETMESLAQEHAMTPEAIKYRRLPGAEGIEPAPQESEQSRIGRSRLARFADNQFYRDAMDKAEEQLRLANPTEKPSELDIRERQHQILQRHVQSLPSVEERSAASKLVQMRFPETRRKQAVRARDVEMVGAEEGSNVAQQKRGEGERTGAYDAREEQPEGSMKAAAARNRTKRTERIVRAGLDESILKAIDGLNEAEAYSHERGVSPEEAKKRWDFHLKNLESAISAQALMEGTHSTYDPTRHGAKADLPSEEEKRRKPRYASATSFDDGGAKGSFEGKTEQPGAMSSEPHEVLNRGFDIIANDQDLLDQFMKRFSRTARTKIQQDLDKLESKPGSRIHSMERGDILRAAVKGLHIESAATQKALSGVRPSQTTERENVKALTPGRYITPGDEEIEAKHVPEEEEVAAINDPARREPILKLMERIAQGKAFDLSRAGGPARVRSEMADAIEKIKSLGILPSDARRIVASPDFAGGKVSDIRNRLAEMSKRSPEETIKRKRSQLSATESIIEGLRNRNPSMNAAVDKIRGVPVPLGVIREPNRGPTPGHTIKMLLGTSASREEQARALGRGTGAQASQPSVRSSEDVKDAGCSHEDARGHSGQVHGREGQHRRRSCDPP
jgi:hypothetical protein